MTDASWVGRRLTIDIERVAHGGHCVGRADGRVVFVRHTLPGEQVIALVTEDDGGRFCRADAVQVLRASAERREPPCRFAHPGGCGGCDWQHVSYDAQLELKAAVVREQLQRLAKVDWPVQVEAVGEPLRWRTRMRYAVDGDRVGLFRSRSAQIVDLDTCLIADPRADVPVAREHAEPTSAAVEIDVATTGAAAVTTIGADRSRTVRGTLNDALVRRDVGDQLFQVSAGGFWQVHAAAPEVLTDAVIDAAAVQPGERVLDLYCGAGLFTAALAQRTGAKGSVIGIEGSRSSVADARRNLAAMQWVSVHRASVSGPQIERIAGRAPVDVVVLDPPRVGARRAVCEAISDLQPRAVVYVACDPSALARDVGTFMARGWQLAALRAFDLFPMTHHVECVATLVRPPASDGPETP